MLFWRSFNLRVGWVNPSWHKMRAWLLPGGVAESIKGHLGRPTINNGLPDGAVGKMQLIQRREPESDSALCSRRTPTSTSRPSWIVLALQFCVSWNKSWKNLIGPSSYPDQTKVKSPHAAHSTFLFSRSLKSLFVLSSGFLCRSSSDSPVTQTVPALSSECPRVKFIPFTIDSSGGRPVFLPGPKSALRVSRESEAYAVSLNCFLEAVNRSIAPWNCFWDDRRVFFLSLLVV